MGHLLPNHEGGHTIFNCKACDTYLTNRNELRSNRFQASTGRAYLFDRAWNLDHSEPYLQEMITGQHILRDVMCRNCGLKLGWMYELAVEEKEKYKEGKVVLEKTLFTEKDGLTVPDADTNSSTTSDTNSSTTSDTVEYLDTYVVIEQALITEEDGLADPEADTTTTSDTEEHLETHAKLTSPNCSIS